ncbi:trimeric LpxA-like protein [Mollisia scopiformis]|uniref:Dynactin subunit 6 n=1 Tax=Mollisia scopiformis TaxID=149040 RepID=A0A194XNZ9_MOLSC|nr:trimeric LpxA-like protein [Mollisia scopiformis]KUJ21913.1 trimeric LpxA-like protein [Mollisia scopiformis]
MSSKRASMMPPAPKPPTSLSSSLVIAEHASLTGTKLITLGSNTVIHPRSKLSSAYAPITIGNSCIISERSQIGIQNEPDEEEADPVVIEDGVIIEVGAVVEGKRIGEGSVIEVNAKVGRGAVLGKHCKIGPLCEVAEGEVLPDYTVLFGNGMRRIDNSGVEDLKMKMVARQVEVLRKLIPSKIAKFQ